MHCVPGGRQGRGPRCVDPWHCRLALEMWNAISLAGKDPEPVREVEQYQLDILELTSMHSTGSGTKPQKGGWIRAFFRVTQGERCWAG